jgi:hypothetical protein
MAPGAAVTGTSIIGVFNVSTRPLTDIIPLASFRGIIPSSYYVIRSHVSGLVTPPVQTTSPSSLVTVSLDVRGYDIYCAYPLAVFHGETRGRFYLANLGLLGKMTGCAAVLHNTFQILENGRVFIDTNVKALGVLGKYYSLGSVLIQLTQYNSGLYISILPDLSIEDDFMVTILGQPIPPHTVKKGSEYVVEIDVETAWNEMSLNSGWSNEVQVKVYFAIEKREHH